PCSPTKPDPRWRHSPPPNSSTSWPGKPDPPPSACTTCGTARRPSCCGPDTTSKSCKRRWDCHRSLSPPTPTPASCPTWPVNPPKTPPPSSSTPAPNPSRTKRQHHATSSTCRTPRGGNRPKLTIGLSRRGPHPQPTQDAGPALDSQPLGA